MVMNRIMMEEINDLLTEMVIRMENFNWHKITRDTDLRWQFYQWGIQMVGWCNAVLRLPSLSQADYIALPDHLIKLND